MQGLLKLGHKIYSNVPVQEFVSNGIYPPFSSLLIDQVGVTSDMSRGHLIVDFFNGLGSYHDHLIDSAKRNKIVLVDMYDSSNFRDYDENFLVFSAHYNTLAQRFGRIFPIGFGVSQEAIEASNEFQYGVRDGKILRNFRPSLVQSVRNSLDLILIPKLKKHFEISEVITSHDQYVSDLQKYKAVLAYGGEIYKDLRLNSFFLGNKAYEFKKLPSDIPVILRFDSWRYYEAALFGACPITLDFQIYGLETSANPEPWKEYIPIDFSEIDKTVSRIVESYGIDPMFFEKIGKNARDWVLKNHSPLGVAKRFLNRMESEGFL